MNAVNLLESVRNGRLCYGLYLTMFDPVIVQMASRAGYDFLRIDYEHMLFDHGVLVNMIRTARLLGMAVQVRVPDLTFASSMLDLGVCGLMVSHVANADEARRAVKAVKYAPLGERGLSGCARVLNYGEVSLSEYHSHANDEVHLIVQIEDRAGLENIDEILDVPGVDMVATGKNDLSQALGVPGQNSHPDVIAAEDLVIRKAREHGKCATLLVKNKDRIDELSARGVCCFVVGRDDELLFAAMKERLDGMRR